MQPDMCQSTKAAHIPTPSTQALLGKFCQGFGASLSVRSPPSLSSEALFFLDGWCSKVVPDQQHQHHGGLVR